MRPVSLLRASLTAIPAALFALVPSGGSADTLTQVNMLRTQGCGGRPAVALPLRAHARLDESARARGRRCGRRPFAAAAPLTRAAMLERAARRHAEDMARHGFLGHGGADGSMPGDRVTRAGYRWARVAENVAAGQRTAEEAVATWLESPGHCANLMNPRFTESGAARVVEPSGDRGVYWVQVFAAPD